MSAHYIKELSSSDSRLHKENVLESVLSAAAMGFGNADTFLVLLHHAYNPYITFGIKQVPESVGIFDQENPWNDFISLLGDLHNRVYTGNRAREEIVSMMNRFDSDEWNLVCASVLRKDMRCGISDKTINKVVGKTKYAIPVFSCQLATNCEDRPEMHGKKRLEPKLDGVRMLLNVSFSDSGSSVMSYSRNGKVFENFGHIEKQVVDNVINMIRAHPDLSSVGGFFLDGEVMGNSFQDLMKQARRKENVKADDSVFHVFDIIPSHDFVRGQYRKSQYDRMQVLEKLRPVFGEMPNVKLVPHIDVDLDTAEGRDIFHRYCNDMVSDGFEGVMIKDFKAFYECKRSTSWLKYKPVITVDLEVIDVEEGTGRNKGRLGALVCRGKDHGRDISVNVGSGFSDDNRDSYWNLRGDIIGRSVEILADAVTMNQDGTYSLRFPRFVRFRDSLTGDKE